MGRLRYGMLVSLDGYARDASGSFDWAAPDLELHAWINARERDVATVVYGRKMWETMRYWQDPPVSGDPASPHDEWAALWQAQDKIIVSSTLDPPPEPRTTLWRSLDLDRLRALVDDSPGDVGISGPTLATAALEAGLVDELTAYVVPHLAGGGLRWLPEGVSGDLVLREQRTFGSGAIALVHDVVRIAS